MTASPLARLDLAFASIADRVGAPCDIAIVLGSGLGHLADAVVNPVCIPYGDITGFPVSTAPGHKGQLVIGDLFGRRCVLMQGRVHLYEGWAPQDVAQVVYLLARLGPKQLIVTNAAGALNPDYRPGEVMLIEDHLNFTGTNPLIGPNDEAIGVRFPDLSRAYDPELRDVARTAAAAAGVPLREGIYVGVAGPSLETSAERRYYRTTGADAVGMSTVLEVIAAAHIGMKVIGLSAICNEATGGPDQQSDTIEDVLANAAIAGEKIGSILRHLLPEL